MERLGKNVRGSVLEEPGRQWNGARSRTPSLIGEGRKLPVVWVRHSEAWTSERAAGARPMGWMETLTARCLQTSPSLLLCHSPSSPTSLYPRHWDQHLDTYPLPALVKLARLTSGMDSNQKGHCAQQPDAPCLCFPTKLKRHCRTCRGWDLVDARGLPGPGKLRLKMNQQAACKRSCVGKRA